MSQKHEKYMLNATRVSLSCNIVLVLIKTTALIFVNSLAIAVDLGISVVGLIVSIILFYSIKLANRPADLLHNYGYGKVENVCEALEGVVLIGIAMAMSSQALLHLVHPKEILMPWVGFGTSAVNAAINVIGSIYILKMARKSHSPAIHAEGVHYKLEGIISGMIAISFIIGLVLSSQGKNTMAGYVDPLAALFVSLLIVVPSFKIARNSFFKLLDASVEEDSQIEILKQLSTYIDKYCEFKDLRTRTAGRNKFVEFTIIVPEDISFKKGYENILALEEAISREIQNCEVVVRMEPCKKDCAYIKNDQTCPYL